MHSMVSKKLNKDKCEGLDEMSLSQFDMLVTQVSLFSLKSIQNYSTHNSL